MRAYFEHQHLVTLADTNAVGNVYFTNYLAWQGACRECFLAARAPSVIAMLSGDFVLVTVSCSCDFFAELYALDQVSVRMFLRSIVANRIVADFDYYRVNHGPAQLVARGNQTVACMTRHDGQLAPAEIPAELVRALAPYAEANSPAAEQLAAMSATVVSTVV
jgi:enediyne core biosynthesis thioesterase